MPPEASPPSDSPEKTPEEESPKAETPDWESLMAPPENPFFPGCPMPGYPDSRKIAQPAVSHQSGVSGVPALRDVLDVLDKPVLPEAATHPQNPFAPDIRSPRTIRAPDNPFIPDYLE